MAGHLENHWLNIDLLSIHKGLSQKPVTSCSNHRKKLVFVELSRKYRSTIAYQLLRPVAESCSPCHSVEYYTPVKQKLRFHGSSPKMTTRRDAAHYCLLKIREAALLRQPLFIVLNAESTYHRQYCFSL